MPAVAVSGSEAQWPAWREVLQAGSQFGFWWAFWSASFSTFCSTGQCPIKLGPNIQRHAGQILGQLAKGQQRSGSIWPTRGYSAMPKRKQPATSAGNVVSLAAAVAACPNSLIGRRIDVPNGLWDGCDDGGFVKWFRRRAGHPEPAAARAKKCFEALTVKVTAADW